MTVIKQDDFIQSISDAFQFISYYHPQDFIDAMIAAWKKERNLAAKNALAQIIINSQMCAENKRPLCQDTGIATVFLKVGMNIQWDAKLSLEEMVNAGVKRAYLHTDNILRASVVSDPAGNRINTKDNTPAVLHVDIVPGDELEITCSAKGGGSENKARLAMLNPSDSVVDWVLKTIPTLGAGWCPPGVIGIGIGGTAEKAMLMAKQSLMSHVDIHELQEKVKFNQKLTSIETLRLTLFEKINRLEIGAQGLGGLSTVLDVKILDYPTHAASLPVALVPNCAATRHVTFTLNGNGPVKLTPPTYDWPHINLTQANTKRLNLDNITKADLRSLKQGEQVLLSGTLLTARDAAHKKLIDLLNNNQPLPVDLTNKIIYYVGPVDPVKDEVVGSAGPTTSTRMDKFTRQLLEQTGVIGMIGKAERGDDTVTAIKENGAVYFMAVGGAAYLVAQTIKQAKVVAFPELGMEAIYEFVVKDMPVTVAVDTQGDSIYVRHLI
ncbi:fumarate hydratase [Zophobihabitans entericus]|uniref:Fumarate hydratase class I n=1 Tax=Zophobihabitans entericus TaxID=1635327 RepID=A0A6G9IC69_9GAMM|nr:fumarate hydratase [Zophobihabitans entericus]QIQ21828.1 fumarate hydratase [Zophobihabitans entericus]